MKKKEFNSKLHLRKSKISNLQENSIHGGADAATSGTYIIITTLKILTEHISRRICPSNGPCPIPIPQPWSEDTICV